MRTTADGRIYTLTDTVGFVRSLPHQLVEAFRSTLEEVGDADLLLHVVDGSHPDPEGQIAAVREVLGEVGAGHLREIVVINKADVADPEVVWPAAASRAARLVVSARTGEGLEELRRAHRGRPAAAAGTRRRPAAVRPGRPGQPGPHATARSSARSTTPEGTQLGRAGRAAAGAASSRRSSSCRPAHGGVTGDPLTGPAGRRTVPS